MTLLGLLKFSALTLVLAGHIFQAQASGRGFFGNKNITVNSSLNIGLCASMITIHGYKCEEHEVTTKDGYILSVQRIPEGRSRVSGNVTKKEPVIVQHGVMVDGQTWFYNSPEQNLPMILADSGFDVWITNTRGTKYSRKHTSLDASQRKYWDWSFDELVAYEMPSIFDYVSKQTGQKVNYVGHSLGTLVPLVALSEGRLANQLKRVALLSPIAYLSHMGTLIGDVAARSVFGESVALLGITEFNPTSEPIIDLIKGVCAQAGLDCNNLFTLLTGENCCLAPSAFDSFLKTEPQSSSTRNLLHLAQVVRCGSLKKFDFERPDINFLHYRQFSPPSYNLENIPKNIPIFMSYGGKDALSDVRDVKHLLEHFKSHDADKLSIQFIKDYAHADYMFGVNANDMVYNDVVKFFNKKF